MTVTIDVFTAPIDKFFVNSFVIESSGALVLVDTQFLVSTARDLADFIAQKGKPLAGIIITHPHPDHFNGLPILLERFGPVPVYANQPTIDTILATQASKRITWTPVYGDDYPQNDAYPDRVISADETLTIGGIEVRSIDLGPGESADITVLHIPAAEALIVSDLIYHRCHPWLAEHRSKAWLDQLAQVEVMFPDIDRIFPGHGPVGNRALFEDQRRYILEQRDAVKAHAREGLLDDVGLAAIREIARRDRNGWPLEALIDLNAASLAEELAKATP